MASLTCAASAGLEWALPELRFAILDKERTSLCVFGCIDSHYLPLKQQSSVRTRLTAKQRRVLPTRAAKSRVGSWGSQDQLRLNSWELLWAIHSSQHSPLTSTWWRFRARKEKFPQTCCEKPKRRMGRWENLRLSWLVLMMFVLPAFVISYCITSVVLYTHNLHRMELLTALNRQWQRLIMYKNYQQEARV